MKQLFPTSQPLEIVYEPPVALEWIALSVGSFVGSVGWIIHRVCFVSWYWSLVGALQGRVSLPRQFDAVYAFINVNFALTQALMVGLVVGAISRRYCYWWRPQR